MADKPKPLPIDLLDPVLTVKQRDTALEGLADELRIAIEKGSTIVPSTMLLRLAEVIGTRGFDPALADYFLARAIERLTIEYGS